MKILFYLSKEYSFPVVSPLVKYIEEKAPNTPYRFYVSKDLEPYFPTEWNKNLRLNGFRQAILFQPDFVLCPGNYVDYRLPGYKVQLFHGLGFEKPAHYKIRQLFDIYLTSGPCVTQRYLELAKKHNHFIVRETGWLKVDHILNFRLDKFQGKLPIYPYKKVILYAPTFSRKMQSASELLAYLPTIIRPEELLLIKFHELMPIKYKESLNLLNAPNIHYLPSGDITPYLHLSQVLLSDTSSVVYEFLILDKPVITYKTLDNEDKGLNIVKPEELRKALDEVMYNNNYDKVKSREALLRVNPFLQGQVAKNVYNVLQEVIEQGLNTPQKKPANLFRKAKILWSFYFSKGNFK
jgi:CDP-glycerol glycerophosphotransferase (TagB/SpsB family)